MIRSYCQLIISAFKYYARLPILLHDLVLNGYVDLVIYLVNRGVSLSSIDNPMNVAIVSNNFKMVLFMESQGYCINKSCLEKIILMIYIDSFDLLKYCVEKYGPKEILTDIYCEIMQGNTIECSLMINYMLKNYSHISLDIKMYQQFTKYAFQRIYTPLLFILSDYLDCIDDFDIFNHVKKHGVSQNLKYYIKKTGKYFPFELSQEELLFYCKSKITCSKN
jgi:hypothetical protein